MGTQAEDDFRRSEHRRMNEELRETLDRKAAERAAELAEKRRTRLHSFGVAGGRRPRGQ